MKNNSVVKNFAHCSKAVKSNVA